MYLGVKGVSEELIVRTQLGMVTTRTVQRVPLEERWPKNLLEMVGGVPWHRSIDDAEADGYVSRPEWQEPRGGDNQPSETQPKVETSGDVTAPRKFRVTIDDVGKHGPTPGCPGCRALVLGKTRQKHTDECRTRLTGAMKDEDKVKRSLGREKEFMERVVGADKRRKVEA